MDQKHLRTTEPDTEYTSLQGANIRMITKVMFRLLPVQILLAAIGSINGIVSSLFASNSVGEFAMSAVTLYSPINMLIGSIGMMLMGGATILCGEHMGRGEPDKMKSIFTLDILVSVLLGIVFMVVLGFMGSSGMTGFFTRDPQVQPFFNTYLLGQVIGVLPFLLGNQLSAFLTLENNIRRTTIASIVFIAVNILLNFLFVQQLHMEAFGLALASSLGMWVFFLIQAQYFVSGRSQLRFTLQNLVWREAGNIVGIGLPGALTNMYQTARGLIVNKLIVVYVGSIGLSAFGACNNLLAFFWAVPTGMIAVSRMLISVSVGEEDRQSLTDVLRVMFRRYLPLQCLLSLLLMVLAVPLTNLFYHDPSQDVYMMTVWGFRLLPVCMPLAVIATHFECYAQVTGRQFFVHLLSLLDGVVCVALFTALLIQPLGMNSVYVANVLNGIIVIVVAFAYSVIKNSRLPRDMSQLIVVPEDFGVPSYERMDLSARSTEEVVQISKQIMGFCEERGIDPRRSYLAGLSMEEMAGNVVEHGFHKDNRRHSVDIRVVHKNGDLILRIKDDCRPFDPAERLSMADPDDITRHIGLRLVFAIAKDIQHQSILGMNVLTIRI